jgi:hypothetical protein
MKRYYLGGGGWRVNGSDGCIEGDDANAKGQKEAKILYCKGIWKLVCELWVGKD